MANIVIQDFRFAFRQLRESKGFTIAAVLTLALGIGANTAIFTLVHAVMLKSLPVADPARLYRLGDGDNCCVIGGTQARFSIFSYPLYLYLRDHTPEFVSMTAFQADRPQVGVRRGSGSSQPFTDEYVAGNYFTTLGIRPFAGRLLSPDDDRPGAPPTAVITYRAWEALGADPALIGGILTIEGAPVTVVGVAPPGFFGDTVGPLTPDFWIPLAAEPLILGRNSLLSSSTDYWLYIIGRVGSGASIAPIEGRLNAELKEWLMAHDPPRSDTARRQFDAQHLALAPAGGGVSTLKENYAEDLRLLIAITGMVLLIACANLANLQLARGAARAPQIAIRAALGAARWRLVREALSESILLALLGGTAGLIVADELAAFLVSLAFPGAKNVPIDSAPSLPVLGFALLLSVITGVVFGLAPAWSASRADAASALRSAGRSAAARSTLPQRSLVVLQAAVSLILLAGAGMMARTLSNLRNQSFGYKPEGRVVAHVNASLNGYAPEKIAAIYRDVERGLKQISGVRNAALSLYSPMTGNNWQTGIALEERPAFRISPSWDRVTPEFFDTVGARIVEGRGFDQHDTPASTHVVVINQAFARQAFPNEDPLGKRFGFGAAHRADYQVVGVVENIRLRDLRHPTDPMFFLPLLQLWPAEWSDRMRARSNLIGDIELHVTANHASLAAEIPRLFAQIDPNLTLVRIDTFDQLVAYRMTHATLIARLIELLGLLAALLACVGLYAITAYAVARRTSEIGIRAALGASRSRVLGMVLGDALGQIAIALAFGIPGSWIAGRVLESELYGVKNGDPFILLGAASALIASAAIAAFWPAWRAAGIDPGSGSPIRVKRGWLCSAAIHAWRPVSEQGLLWPSVKQTPAS